MVRDHQGRSMRRFLLPLLSLCFLSVGVFLLSSTSAAASPQPAVQQSSGPSASFTVSSGSQSSASPYARVHDSVSFDASQSQGTSLTYSWSFGDNSAPAAGQKATHAFGLVDDYTVTLTVKDQSGQTATATQSVRIIPLIRGLVSNPPLKQIAAGAVIPATLYIQAPGPSVINASLAGDLINGKPVAFSTPDALAYAPLSGQVANETNDTIDKQLIQVLNGSILLKGNVGVDISYQTTAGSNVDLAFTLDLQKDPDPSKGIWSITYPNFSLVTGTTDPSQPDVGGYYLTGDPAFHHADDPLVRKYALMAARAGGSLSDDPDVVMTNVYTFVGGLLGSDDPAQLDPDTVIAQKILDGDLVPGAQSQTYICIAQTYFLSSLARTLGLPSRELTIGLANPVSQDAAGAWTVDYVQEGATEVWFGNTWHLFDTWLKIRNLDDYLIRKYAYQAWYANSAQSFELVAKNGDPLGIRGHDFAIGELVGTTASPDEWTLAQRKVRPGLSVTNFPTS